jgi:hypothetical protein
MQNTQTVMLLLFAHVVDIFARHERKSQTAGKKSAVGARSNRHRHHNLDAPTSLPTTSGLETRVTNAHSCGRSQG